MGALRRMLRHLGCRPYCMTCGTAFSWADCYRNLGAWKSWGGLVLGQAQLAQATLLHLCADTAWSVVEPHRLIRLVTLFVCACVTAAVSSIESAWSLSSMHCRCYVVTLTLSHSCTWDSQVCEAGMQVPPAAVGHSRGVAQPLGSCFGS